MEFNNLKIDDEIVYVDASESGEAHYIHGIIVDKTDDRISLKVIDEGSFFSVGFIPSLSEATYSPGDVAHLRKKPYSLFLSPTEFKKYRKSVESLPELVEEIEPKEVEVPVEAPEEEEDFDPTSVFNPAEEISPEEGSPDYDEDEEGLQLQAKILTIGSLDELNIIWPKNYPEQWMKDVYNALEKSNIGLGPGGEPAVSSPGGKGLVPQESIAVREKVDSLGKLQKQLINEVNQLQQVLDTAEADLVVLKDKNEPEEISSKLREIESLKNTLSDKNKTLSEVAHQRDLATAALAEQYKRNPEEAVYSKVPGGHRSRDVASGRVALINELKTESDKYKKTLDAFEDLKKLQKTFRDSQRELDLILSFRKKKLVDMNHGLSSEADWEFMTDPYAKRSEGDVLKELASLKFQSIKGLPYFWPKAEFEAEFPLQKTAAVPGDKPKNWSRPGHPYESYANKLFKKYMGNSSRTFFDLIPEEIENLAKQWAAVRPVEETLSEEEVATRAHEFAEEYKDRIVKEIHYRDIVKPLQEYIEKRYNLSISDRAAKEIDNFLTLKPTYLTITGRNAETGAEEKIKVNSEELRVNVKKPLSKPFEQRALWLRAVQDGRKKAIEAMKEQLRRDLAVIRNKSFEDEIKSSLPNLNNLVASSYNFTNTWHKTHSKNRASLLESSEFKRLENQLKKYQDQISEIKSKDDYKDFIDESRFEAAEENIEEALKAIKEEDFNKAASEVESFKRNFEDIYITPPLDAKDYKKTIFEIFKKYQKISDVKVEPREMSRYLIENPEKLYDKKETELQSLIKKEKDIREEIAILDGQKNELYTPYKEATEAFEKFRVELGGISLGGDITQEVDRISLEIKELLKEVGKFVKGKKDIDVASLFNKIKQLKDQRQELLRKGISKDLWSKLDAREATLEALYKEYEDRTKKLFEQREAFQEQLYAVEKKKYDLMEELDIKPQETRK